MCRHCTKGALAMYHSCLSLPRCPQPRWRQRFRVHVGTSSAAGWLCPTGESVSASHLMPAPRSCPLSRALFSFWRCPYWSFAWARKGTSCRSEWSTSRWCHPNVMQKSTHAITVREYNCSSAFINSCSWAYITEWYWCCIVHECCMYMYAPMRTFVLLFIQICVFDEINVHKQFRSCTGVGTFHFGRHFSHTSPTGWYPFQRFLDSRNELNWYRKLNLFCLLDVHIDQ